MALIRKEYFLKTIAAYRSGYLGSLKVALKIPTYETRITNADNRFGLMMEHSADYTHHRQQFATWLSVSF